MSSLFAFLPLSALNLFSQAFRCWRNIIDSSVNLVRSSSSMVVRLGGVNGLQGRQLKHAKDGLIDVDATD